MSGCKAKWLTFGKSRVRVRGKSTSFPHFAYILSLAPFNWKSRDYARYNDVITNGKKSTIYKPHAWPRLDQCCAPLCKNMAQIGRQNTKGGFVTEMFLILAIILATKGTFSQSFRQVKWLQYNFAITNWVFCAHARMVVFLREKRSQTLKKGWFKHSWKWKSKLQIKALCRGMFIYRRKILRITAGELRQLAAATYIDLRQNSGRSARG